MLGRLSFRLHLGSTQFWTQKAIQSRPVCPVKRPRQVSFKAFFSAVGWNLLGDDLHSFHLFRFRRCSALGLVIDTFHPRCNASSPKTWCARAEEKKPKRLLVCICLWGISILLLPFGGLIRLSQHRPCKARKVKW